MDLLQSTVGGLEESHASAVQQFLAAKAKVDLDPGAGLEVLVPLMGLATQVGLVEPGQGGGLHGGLHRGLRRRLAMMACWLSL